MRTGEDDRRARVRLPWKQVLQLLDVDAAGIMLIDQRAREVADGSATAAELLYGTGDRIS